MRRIKNEDWEIIKEEKRVMEMKRKGKKENLIRGKRKDVIIIDEERVGGIIEN